MFPFARSNQCSIGDQILQIASGRCRWCPSDASIFVRAESTSKAIWTFAKHSGQGFFLTRIQLSAHAVVELGFFFFLIDPLVGVILSGHHQFGEIHQPISHVDLLVVHFQSSVVRIAVAFDGKCQRD